MINVSGKLQIKQSGKETQTAEVLDKNKGNMKWVMEDGSYKYQLWKGEQLQKHVFDDYEYSLFCYE